MYAFDYTRPKALNEASDALQADGDAKLLAGGMTLLPTMKQRLAAPSTLIDIAQLAELRGLSLESEAGGPATHIRIGAAMRHCEVADSAELRQHLPALADLAGGIGDPQVRARGTLGGSVANNDPAADYPAGLLGLDARVLTNQREIGADDFFVGMFSTALAPDEIITAVRFRIPRRAAYAKFAQAASGYALTGVLVADFGGDIRVAVTGAGPGVFRWKAAEQALAARFEPAALASLNHPADDLNSDLHASAAYRAQLIKVMTQRAVRRITA